MSIDRYVDRYLDSKYHIAVLSEKAAEITALREQIDDLTKQLSEVNEMFPLLHKSLQLLLINSSGGQDHFYDYNDEYGLSYEDCERVEAWAKATLPPQEPTIKLSRYEDEALNKALAASSKLIPPQEKGESQ